MKWKKVSSRDADVRILSRKASPFSSLYNLKNPENAEIREPGPENPESPEKSCVF